jgi:Holliday junction resolvasome RuvABC DNA-binding subunit
LEKEWNGVALPLAPENADVIAALTGLGYSVAEATKAIARLPDTRGLGLEEKIRVALQQLAER